MAEIHIQKKRNPLWLAVVALLLLLLAVWAVTALFGDDADDTLTTGTPAVATEVGESGAGETDAVPPAAPEIAEPAIAAASQAAAPTADFVVPDVDARATPLEPQLRSPYIGRFVSDSISLFIRADGTYEITRSAAGPGRGPWTVLRDHGVLFLDPQDGTQDRYFRIQDPDTLIPLNPQGEQPAQMTELLRRQPEGDTAS